MQVVWLRLFIRKNVFNLEQEEHKGLMVHYQQLNMPLLEDLLELQTSMHHNI
jgi:hypothetical protein